MDAAIAGSATGREWGNAKGRMQRPSGFDDSMGEMQLTA
jgi:hypothetical protein